MLIFKVFVTLPLQFSDNNSGGGKKRKKENNQRALSGTELFTSRCVGQVCFHTLHARVCCVSQPIFIPRDKYGLLNLCQRFDREHMEAEAQHEGSGLNSAPAPANLKAEDSIFLYVARLTLAAVQTST